MDNKHQLIETHLLSAAMDAINKQTNVKLIDLSDRKAVATGEILLGVKGINGLQFTVITKRWAQQASLGLLVNLVKQLPDKAILVADYVNPKMADKLRQFDVAFIDTVGNAYINHTPLYVFIKGNKYDSKIGMIGTQAEPIDDRAFQPAGLKVVAALMREPELITATYRELANEAGVALGSVGWVINALKRDNFLIEYSKKQRKLVNKAALLDKWADAYLEKFRPKLFIGSFSADYRAWWVELDDNIVKYGARWGGEVVAAKLTGDFEPENITIYMHKDGGNQLLSQNRLHNDPNGNIHLYRAFWNESCEIDTNKNSVGSCVNAMVVYADLLATANTKNLNAAKFIYDKIIPIGK